MNISQTNVECQAIIKLIDVKWVSLLTTRQQNGFLIKLYLAGVPGAPRHLPRLIRELHFKLSWIVSSRTLDHLRPDQRGFHEPADDVPRKHDPEPGEAEQAGPQPHDQQDHLQGRSQVPPGSEDGQWEHAQPLREAG